MEYRIISTWKKRPNKILPFLDVISIDKTGENFRLIYDVKGRFTVHRISTEEAKVSRQTSIFFFGQIEARSTYNSKVVESISGPNKIASDGHWLFQFRKLSITNLVQTVSWKNSN